jgi:hypothetical protein
MTRLKAINTLCNAERQLSLIDQHAYDVRQALNSIENLLTNEELKEFWGDKKFEIDGKEVGLEELVMSFYGLMGDVELIESNAKSAGDDVNDVACRVDQYVQDISTDCEEFVDAVETDGDIVKLVMKPKPWNFLKVKQLELSHVSVQKIME